MAVTDAPSVSTSLWSRENLVFIGLAVGVIYVLITTLNAIPWVTKPEHTDLMNRVAIIEQRQTDVRDRLAKLEILEQDQVGLQERIRILEMKQYLYENNNEAPLRHKQK